MLQQVFNCILLPPCRYAHKRRNGIPMRSKFLTAALLLCSTVALAQCFPGTSVLDGVSIRSQNMFKPPMRYDHLREADAAWVKRTWRKIDVRQKQNHPFAFPRTPQPGRRSLFDALVCAIVWDKVLTAYHPGPLGQSDDFTLPITSDECGALINREVTTQTTNLNTGTTYDTTYTVQYTTEDVVHYMLKEEWFFDKQRGVMDVRILGLAPVVEVRDLNTGDFKGYKTLFWVYYPEARVRLSNEVAINRGNDVEQRSFDEIFQKRMFSSVIIKESNVYDRYISEYRKGISALLEAEAMLDGITNYEHDWWSF